MRAYRITIRCQPDDLACALLDMHDAMEAVRALVSDPRAFDHQSKKWSWTLDACDDAGQRDHALDPDHEHE